MARKKWGRIEYGVERKLNVAWVLGDLVHKKIGFFATFLIPVSLYI